MEGFSLKKVLLPKPDSTLEQELINLVQYDGFSLSTDRTVDDRPIYERTWTREDNVLWIGKFNAWLKIQVFVRSGSTIINISSNCHVKEGFRHYSSPKRAYNAIQEIVLYARFDLKEGA